MPQSPAPVICPAGAGWQEVAGDRVQELVEQRLLAARPARQGMDGVGKVFRGEEFGYPLIGLVVGQQGAEQGLLRLDVGGREALGQTEERRIDGVHAGILAEAESWCID